MPLLWFQRSLWYTNKYLRYDASVFFYLGLILISAVVNGNKHLRRPYFIYLGH